MALARSAPPILDGRDTAVVRAGIAALYGRIAAIFELWVARRESPHTQRA